MPRRESEPIVRRHVHLFEKDVAFLEETYGHSISMNTAIRKIVRQKVRALQTAIAQRIEKDDLTIDGSEAGELAGALLERPAPDDEGGPDEDRSDAS